MELEIYLTSGQTLRAHITSWKLKYNGLSQVVGAEWETPAQGPDAVRKLSYLDIEKIAAVVVVYPALSGSEL